MRLQLSIDSGTFLCTGITACGKANCQIDHKIPTLTRYAPSAIQREARVLLCHIYSTQIERLNASQPADSDRPPPKVVLNDPIRTAANRIDYDFNTLLLTADPLELSLGFLAGRTLKALMNRMVSFVGKERLAVTIRDHLGTGAGLPINALVFCGSLVRPFCSYAKL